MEFALTPEQELIGDSARAFCDREILPHSRKWDRSEWKIGRALTGGSAFL